MEEDSTWPVTVSRTLYDKENNRRVLIVEECIGDDLVDTFFFPRGWDPSKSWGVLKCENFKKLVRQGNVINITFTRQYLIIEITSTEPGIFINYLITNDAGDDFPFLGLSPPESKSLSTTSTTSTCPTTCELLPKTPSGVLNEKHPYKNPRSSHHVWHIDLQDEHGS